MSLIAGISRISLSRTQLAFVILISVLVGGFGATLVPFGTVPLRVIEGHGWLLDSGSGGFQAKGEEHIMAEIPENVGRPSCLWDAKTDTPLRNGARVEVAYRWIKPPVGGCL